MKCVTIASFSFLILLGACAPSAKTDGGSQAVQISKGDSSIAEKYWKLTELYGKPIPPPGPNLPEAHMIFKFEGGKVEGNGGCNSFSGQFELGDGNRITISKLAVTMMACPAMETESEFLKVLGNADNYVMRVDTLILNKARMAPLAKFEAVYLR